MAADEFLLYQAREINPILRLYSWKPAALSLGYAQSLDRHVHLGECRRKKIPVVRRVTGGKAVFHDQELTYSVTGMPGNFPFKGDLMESYRNIALAFIASMKKLGIDAAMAPRKTRPAKGFTASCFANPSSYEIVVNGKKLIGSAQKRTNRGILQHGSILMEYDGADWVSLLSGASEQDSERITGIRNETDSEVSFEDVATAVIKGFQETFNMTFIRWNPEPDVVQKIIQIAQEGYPDLAKADKI